MFLFDIFTDMDQLEHKKSNTVLIPNKATT